MRILMTSDIHIGINLGDYDRRDDVLESLHQIKTVIDNYSPDIFMFTGDMFHSNVNLSENIKHFIDLLDFCAGHVSQSYFLVGNHDLVEQKGKTHALDIGDAPEHIEIVDDLKFIHIGPDKYGILIPHISRSKSAVSPEDQIAAITDQFAEYPQNAEFYIFSHCNVSFVDPTSQVLFKFNHHTLPKELIDHPKVKYVFNGHFHKPHQEGKLWLIGSPQAYTMDERADMKRMLLLDTDKGEIEQIGLGARPMVQYNLDFASNFDEAHLTYTELMKGGTDTNNVIIKVVIKIKEEDLPKIDLVEFEKRLNELYAYTYKPHTTIQREKRLRIKELTSKDDPDGAIKKFCKEYDRERLIPKANSYRTQDAVN